MTCPKLNTLEEDIFYPLLPEIAFSYVGANEGKLVLPDVNRQRTSRHTTISLVKTVV